MLTLGQLFEIIISECENGCTNQQSTISYFYKHHADKFNTSELFILTTCLNFEAIRRMAPHITVELE